MDYIHKLPIEFQFVEASYTTTVKNLYAYHEVNQIPILYEGFCEDIARDFFKANDLDYEEAQGFEKPSLQQLSISGM